MSYLGWAWVLVVVAVVLVNTLRGRAPLGPGTGYRSMSRRTPSELRRDYAARVKADKAATVTRLERKRPSARTERKLRAARDSFARYNEHHL